MGSRLSLTSFSRISQMRLPWATGIARQRPHRPGMVGPEESAERRQREGSRLDFRKKSHTCQGSEQTVHGLRMCLRLLCKRSACLLPSGEQISQIELGRDTNRGRDPVPRHEMVELYVRCLLTQPLKIRLTLDSLTHH